MQSLTADLENDLALQLHADSAVSHAVTRVGPHDENANALTTPLQMFRKACGPLERAIVPSTVPKMGPCNGEYAAEQRIEALCPCQGNWGENGLTLAGKGN